MKINTMRNIDYYFGILICFFLTIIDKILKIFKSPKSGEIKNVLFIQLTEMGSTVLAYSSIRKMKELYPNAKLFFLAFKKNRYCIETLNIISKENILTIRDDSFLIFAYDTLKVLLKLRRERIGVSFDFELFSRFSMIISYLSGATNTVGFYNYYQEGLYRGNLLTHKVYYNIYQHMTLNFLSLVYSITSKMEVPLLKMEIPEEDVILPEIKITEEARKNIWDKLKKLNPEINPNNRLIIVNPYAGDIIPIRSWPIDYYIMLIRELLKNKNVFIIITGGGDTKNWKDKIIDEIKDERIISLVGSTGFNELIDLYNISDILITNDSGPVHFASLTPIKVFAFFGPGHIIYGPLGKNTTIFYKKFSCSPCGTAFNHRNSPCKDNKCLKAIKVGGVYKEISRYL